MGAWPLDNTPEPRPPRWASVSLIALLVWVGGLVKPAHIDDPAVIAYAKQIAQRPLDPYGFEIFWRDWPEPAFHHVVPIGLPYWLAPAVGLFPNEPLLWKAWLLPVCFLFVLAIQRILERFAPELANPALFIIVLSPVFWPSLNLMIDIPALALGLVGLNLVIAAVDRRSVALATLAGVVAGVAVETKFTALSLVAAGIVFGLLREQFVVAGTFTFGFLLSFGAIEGALAARYGQSFFVWHVGHPSSFQMSRWEVGIGLIQTLGGIGLAAIPWGLAALGARRIWVIGAAALGLTALVLIGFGSDRKLLWDLGLGSGELPVIIQPIFLLFGAAILALWSACGIRMAGSDASRNCWFLPAWLIIELVASGVLSPYVAARRVMGIWVAGMVLAASAFGRLPAGRRDRPLAWGLAALGTAVGLVFAAVDWTEARMIANAPAEAAAMIASQNPQGKKVWFTGHWGVQFAADKAGMQPLVGGQSRVAAGDWIISFPDVDRQQVFAAEQGLELVAVGKQAAGLWGLRTIPYFYGALFPIGSAAGQEFRTVILRAKTAFTPALEPGLGMVGL